MTQMLHEITQFFRLLAEKKLFAVTKTVGTLGTASSVAAGYTARMEAMYSEGVHTLC